MDVKVGLLALELGIDSLPRLPLPDFLYRFGNHAQPARFAIDLARIRIASRFDFHSELYSRSFSVVLLVS